MAVEPLIAVVHHPPVVVLAAFVEGDKKRKQFSVIIIFLSDSNSFSIFVKCRVNLSVNRRIVILLMVFVICY